MTEARDVTFRETRLKHIQAIQDRDLEALLETVSPDELTLVASDGRIVRTAAEFARMHREWFESTSWSLDIEEVSVIESPAQGAATLRLEYRDETPGGEAVSRWSVLTLLFALRDRRWAMVLDQNTPIKEAAPEARG
jgi:ketosteroid isomerase-like protein